MPNYGTSTFLASVPLITLPATSVISDWILYLKYGPYYTFSYISHICRYISHIWLDPIFEICPILHYQLHQSYLTCPNILNMPYIKQPATSIRSNMFQYYKCVYITYRYISHIWSVPILQVWDDLFPTLVSLLLLLKTWVPY